MSIEALKICDLAAREEFCLAARRLSIDPHDAWVGGYVDYEWTHGRHVFECSGVTIPGLRVLEFGCNFGATAIVLTTLGARVTGVDVNSDYVALARLNAACYGLEQKIAFLQVPDAARLPFGDEQFDLVNCNSVLEYVPHAALGSIQRELDRVLKPGGFVMVLGTSNRLWPREMHSHRWFVNYLPRFVDRLFSIDLQRGVFPWQVRFGFGSWYRDAGLSDAGAAYLEARRRMGVNDPQLMLLRTAIRLLRPLGTTVGLFTPSISVLLSKEPASQALKGSSKL